MEARYELQRFTIGGVRLLLALVALVLIAAATGYGVRALTFRIPVNTTAPAATSKTAPSYDDWLHDLSSQRAAQTVPDDSRIPQTSPVQVHEGR